MTKARKNKAEDQAAETDSNPAGTEEITETATAPAEPADPTTAQAEVNPFPRVIKRADFGDYAVRLLQDQKSNEMQIRFGEGRPQDKPADVVLGFIRSHRVPEEFKTRKERDEGKDVPWFQFSTAKGAWCMWMRNQPHVARTKAEQVFDGAVSMISQELRTPPERSEGVPF